MVLQNAAPLVIQQSAGLPLHSLFSLESSVGIWRKEGKQGGEGSPGAWAPHVASCGTEEGSQGSLGGSYPVERRERWGKGEKG